MKHSSFSNDVEIFKIAAGQSTPHSAYRRVWKYVLDLSLIVLALPLLLPVFAILTVLAMLDGGAPFYAHERVGKGGRLFRCFKFRSMVPDAEARLKAMLDADEQARFEWEHYQKLKNDPRITRVGRFLRASSLDELPQLFNVIRGEMSLVGPRPFMPDQDALYREAGGLHYYDMNPGLTGAWQVSSRNGSSFVSRVDYDDAYFHQLSFRTDMNILLKTFGVVLKCTGH